MLQVLFTILSTLLLLTILVFIHELGHFLAAKLFKANVKEFAIGFGKRIVSKKYKGTIYSIRILPLGGFVDLEGEVDSNTTNSFRNKRAYQKIIILAAGVFMNVIFAFFALGLFLSSNSYKFTIPSLTNYSFSNTSNQLELYPLFISSVDEDGNSNGQLEVGEVIVSIDGNFFKSYGEFTKLIDERQNMSSKFGFFDLESFEISEKEVLIGEKDENGAILNVGLFELNRNGSTSYPAYYLQYNESLFAGVSLTTDLLAYIPLSLGSIISESFQSGNFTELGNSVGSPLQIIDNSNQIIEAGVFEAFIPLSGLLSISLAIFNILPFPALDGGQIVVVLIEKLIRRKIPDHVLEKVNLGGFIILISFAVLMIFKDFIQLNVISKIGDLINSII